MRKIISNFYRQSSLGYITLRPFYLFYEEILKRIPDEIIIKSSFKKHLGYKLNLQNPKTLNEKINWLKINDRSEIHTAASDKYAVREYIKSKIGYQYLIPLLYHTTNASDLTQENLPDLSFIIKATHNSSGGVIVRDKSKINWDKVQISFKRLLKENYFYSSREWQYKNITPRIVVEKLLTNKDGSIPTDYKFHCFNGKLGFVQVDLDRHIGHKRNLYDVNWEFIPCIWKYPNGKKEDKPDSFDKMKNLAETIAMDFLYIRVDFYCIDDKIYFGELTFHSESGLGKFSPPEYDLKFGNLLNLNI